MWMQMSRGRLLGYCVDIFTQDGVLYSCPVFIKGCGFVDNPHVDFFLIPVGDKLFCSIESCDIP
jgi:hypothetical protein